MTTPSTNRIEAFSDGVMAILITILVLELKVPQLAEHFSHEAFREAALHLLPKIIAYAFSFLVIAIFWVNHHHFFHLLDRSDAGLLWHNNHLLFWMSLIPLPTAFIGEHPDSPQAIMAYAGVMMMTALSFTLMSRHAMFKGRLMKETIDRKGRMAIMRRSLTGPVLYAAALIGSFIHPFVSYAFFIAVPVYFFWPKAVAADRFSHHVDQGPMA